MALNPPTNLDKAAILLRLLPAPSLEKVLEMVGEESSTRLRFAMEAVAIRTDLTELERQILEEFREMQREVKEALRGSTRLEQLHNGIGSSGADNSISDQPGQLPIQPVLEMVQNAIPKTASSPEVAELLAIPPEVLAAALQRETPRSIAIVLRQLPTDFAGKVLEKLPADQRQQIFMMLAIKSTIHPAVTRSVLQAVTKVCKTIDLSSASQQDARFKTLIGILQMVDREERLRLMEALTEQDEELAAQIDDNLYDYTDIMRIQDRSVQKLLTQLELKVVAIALKTAPAEILEKVMRNLSERVRATLNEEMDLISSVSPSKVEQARKDIANVIRMQDKDGTLQWIE
jgi:flagellar motor switch protein FliG